ncbi:MAG: DUF1588 domain-containing protein [Myxococcota bacterium]
MKNRQPWNPDIAVLALGLALSGGAAGCNETSEPGPTGPEPEMLVADPAPLTRLTAEQYNNTVRDLFDPVPIGHIIFPVELEGRGGFENNVTLNTATPALVETYQRAARQVADAVLEDLPGALGCDPNAGTCARDWLVGFAERAWRRPLTTAEQEVLLQNFDTWATDHDVTSAVTLSITFLLQSPDFIYVPRLGADAPAPGEAAIPLTDWELAARLSYFLWNSTPDAELMDLAREGRLRDRQVLADQAFRMLADWRAVDMVVSFHRQNWDFDDVGANPIDLDFYGPVFEERGMTEEDDKSDFYYLEYSPQARFESDVFIAQHVFYGDSRLETLLTTNRTWVTQNVAEIAYQQPLDTESEPVSWSALIPQEGNDQLRAYQQEYFPIELDPTQRAGLFTMVGFLIAKAGPSQPAPVRRGVTIIDRLLCTELHPPGDVPPLEEAETEAPRTNREKYEIHKRSEACAGCHASIDGIGLTFENYDSMGRWRDTDNGFPVDASGELLSTDQDGPVSNAVELMRKLGSSRTVHDCYTRQWFRYAFGRNETIDDAPTVLALQEGFWNSDGNIIELVVNLAGSYSFRHRRGQP